MGSPASTVLRGIPTPCRPSLGASLPSHLGTTLRPGFLAPPRPGAPATTREGHRLPESGSGRGDDRASQVPGEPPAHMRCSRTPVGPACQAISARRRGLPRRQRRRLPRIYRLRGSITPPMGSLSTLRRPRHHDPRKTRFRLLASSAGRGWLPAGLHYEVSRLYLLHLILLVQASPGALTVRHKEKRRCVAASRSRWSLGDRDHCSTPRTSPLAPLPSRVGRAMPNPGAAPDSRKGGCGPSLALPAHF